MTTFLDTSILIDLVNVDSEFHEWSKSQLETAKEDGPVIVSDMVFCEFSVGMNSLEDSQEVVRSLSLARTRMSDEALFLAGRAFKEYRENGGPRESLLPDFMIGAVAQADKAPLITRDPRRVRNYFPEVELVCPD